MGLGIVGREKNIEVEVYSTFYGPWSMNEKLSFFNFRMFWCIVRCVQARHGLLNFHYKLSRVLWFVIHGIKHRNYKEHRVLETSSLATL
jgi:hypothetical protein